MVSNFKDFPPFIQHFSPQFIPLIGSFRKVAVNLPVTGPTTAPSHHQPPIQPPCFIPPASTLWPQELKWSCFR